MFTLDNKPLQAINRRNLRHVAAICHNANHRNDATSRESRQGQRNRPPQFTPRRSCDD